MQAICCRLFQSASSSSASIFCTYSMADSSPASSLTIPCQKESKTCNILRLPPRSARFTLMDKQEAAWGCVPSAALGSGRAEDQAQPRQGAPLHPGGPAASCTHTLRIWSSAVSICSSCCIFWRVTDWLFPFRSCISAQRGEELSARHTDSSCLPTITQKAPQKAFDS